MAINQKVSQIKIVAGRKAEVSQAVQASPEVREDALLRSLQSLKFVPLISDDKQHQENEMELARAKSVLDQICNDAEETWPKQKLVDSVKEAIKSSGMDVNPLIVQQLEDHILAKPSWKHDILIMEQPTVDNSVELLEELVSKTTNGNAEQESENVTEVAQSEATQSEATQSEVTQSEVAQSEVAQSEVAQSEVTNTVDSGLAKAEDASKSNDSQLDIDLDKILNTTLTPETRVAGDGQNTLSKLNSVPHEDEKTAQEKIAKFKVELEAANVNQKNNLTNQFIGKNPELRNDPFITKLLDSSKNNQDQYSDLSDVDQSESKFQSEKNQLAQTSSNQSKQQPSNFPGNNQGSGFGINFNFGGSPADKQAREARSAFKSINKSIANVERGLNDRVRGQNQIEKTLRANGVDITYDKNGRWSDETLVAINDTPECKPIMKNLQATEKLLDKNATSLTQDIGKVKLNGENIPNELLNETLENSNSLIDKSKKDKKSNYGEDPHDNRNMLEKLVEIIKELIDSILKMLGFKSNQDYQQSKSERKEPVIDTENLAPQP
jgi:hypothetical protein